MSEGVARCPVCRRIDWFWDGLVLVERSDGTLSADRVEPQLRTEPDDWSCMACGYEVPRWSATSRLLAQIAVAARWSEVSLTVSDQPEALALGRTVELRDPRRRRGPGNAGPELSPG